MSKENEVGLDQIVKAESLSALNELLTQSMKEMKIQQLIKGDNLLIVVEAIADLTADAPEEDELFAAAIVGRLAAVARGREREVFGAASEIFTCEPTSIETLADGDAKEYAARVIAQTDAPWVIAYCAREALLIDTANNARKELLRTVLQRSGNVSDGLRQLALVQAEAKSTEQPDSRARRVRRVCESLAEVVREGDAEVGSEPGGALFEMFEGFFGRSINAVDSEVLHACLDAVVSILARFIELRFSYALQADTYQLIAEGKKRLSPGPWARFIEGSTAIPKVQVNLLETALVLARQNRTDKEILRVMLACWASVSQVSTALKRHFKGAADIDPDVADYWLKAGRVTQSDRAAEHKLGNSEDQQIGELLIQIDANRDIMGKLNSAVVPVLKTFDPCQAATVQRAATGYESIAQVAERLARMRKLSKTDWLGALVEYNPLEHDMEGGHRSGVRSVRIVRDGIRKEFGGKTKMLVKPRVEPEG
ncbi:MAG TPA: hypothetical protein PLX09_02655 [Xanthomonadaceae bacterium]|nr:hypothetical protein [Xanthomonadaceae bacterium]